MPTFDEHDDDVIAQLERLIAGTRDTGRALGTEGPSALQRSPVGEQDSPAVTHPLAPQVFGRPVPFGADGPVSTSQREPTVRAEDPTEAPSRRRPHEVAFSIGKEVRSPELTAWLDDNADMQGTPQYATVLSERNKRHATEQRELATPREPTTYKAQLKGWLDANSRLRDTEDYATVLEAWRVADPTAPSKPTRSGGGGGVVSGEQPREPADATKTGQSREDRMAQWLLDNRDLKGTKDYNTIAQAYTEVRGLVAEGAAEEEPGFWEKVRYGWDKTNGLTVALAKKLARSVVPREGALPRPNRPEGGFNLGLELLSGRAGRATSDLIQDSRLASPEEVAEIEAAHTAEQDQELAATHPRVHGTAHADSVGTLVGQIASYLADPTIVLGPTAGMGLKGTAAVNAAVGGADAALVQWAEDGEINWNTALATAAAAAALGPVGEGVVAGATKIKAARAASAPQRAAKKALKLAPKEAQKADKLLAKGAANKKAYLEIGLNEAEASSRAIRDIGLDPTAKLVKGPDTVHADSLGAKLIADLQRDVTPLGARGVVVQAEAAKRLKKLVGTDRKLERFASMLNKTMAKEAKKAAKGRNTFGHYYQSAYDAMSKVSPRLANRLRRYESRVAGNTVDMLRGKLGLLGQNGSQAASAAMKAWNKTQAPLKRKVTVAMLNGDADTLATTLPLLAQPVQDAVAAWKVARVEYKKRITESGHGDLDWVEEYFPRVFKDQNSRAVYFKARGASDKDLSTAFSDLDAGTAELGNALSQEQRVFNLNKALTERKISKGVGTEKSANMKTRLVEEIKPLETHQFLDPLEGIIKYVGDVEKNLAKRSLFGLNPDDITSSLGRHMDDLVQKGDLTQADALVARNILHARFVQGEKGMAKPLSEFRTWTNMAVLANPKAALVQLGDIGVSMAQHGVRNTMRSIFDVAGKRNEWNKVDLGIVEVGAEFADAARSGKAMDKALTWTGFKNMDSFGKNVAVNASLRKLNRQATHDPEKLTRVYKDALTQEELTTLMGALGKPKKALNEDESGLVSYVLFNELSNMQPVSMTELPVKYLEHPNGRLFYQLKSFAIKQFELTRREFWSKLTKGRSDTKEALQFGLRYLLGTQLMSGGAALGGAALTGKLRDTESAAWEDFAILDGLWQTVASSTGVLNEYSASSLARGDAEEAVMGNLVPPGMSVAGRVANATLQGKWDKAGRYIPGVGVFLPWLKEE